MQLSKLSFQIVKWQRRILYQRAIFKTMISKTIEDPTIRVLCVRLLLLSKLVLCCPGRGCQVCCRSYRFSCLIAVLKDLSLTVQLSIFNESYHSSYGTQQCRISSFHPRKSCASSFIFPTKFTSFPWSGAVQYVHFQSGSISAKYKFLKSYSCRKYVSSFRVGHTGKLGPFLDTTGNF